MTCGRRRSTTCATIGLPPSWRSGLGTPSPMPRPSPPGSHNRTRAPPPTGIKGPCYGPIRKKRVFEHKATVRADRWTRLGVELEIILIMGANVPAPKGKPYDKDSIAQYIGEARAGFELIEDRGADYSRL